VRAVVSDPRKVVYNPARQEILVIGDPSVQAQVKALVAQLDRPSPNVQITVQFEGDSVSSGLSGGIGVEGDIFGRREGGTSGSVNVSPSLQAGQTTTRSNTAQMLVVQSGKEARLSVGQRVPQLEWLMTRGLTFSTAQATVNWQDVGAFLVIQPVIVGEGVNRMVKVRVTPELSGTVDGNPYQIRYSRVSTEVLAREGQPVDLGGLTGQNEVFARFLIGMDRQGRTSHLKIKLTPDILD
jgi:type II secretory pathway component GspD/PulD (secretin)